MKLNIKDEIMIVKAIKYKQSFLDPRNIYVKKIEFKPPSLGIRLYSSKNETKFKIEFKTIHSFALADEGDLLDYFPETRIGIYIIENSQYLKMFHNSASYCSLEKNIFHFLIATTNEIIDVLSSDQPELSSGTDI